MQFYPPGALTHRLKLAADARFDEFSQDLFSNLLGTFSYNSLADLAANRPSSFTRTLSAPTRRGGEWNAFASLGDLWRVNEKLQVIYGARIDGNVFTQTPDYNPTVSSAFSLRTDRGPNSVDVSPRLGFTWQNAWAGCRGGSGSSGTSSTPRYSPRRRCRPDCRAPSLGCRASVPQPTPDWSTYAIDPSSIPSNAGGLAPTTSRRMSKWSTELSPATKLASKPRRQLSAFKNVLIEGCSAQSRSVGNVRSQLQSVVAVHAHHGRPAGLR